MRVATLFSGGKDSTYATYVAMQRGWAVTHLISVYPSDPDSMLFHVPNVRVTALLAEAMGIEHLAGPTEVGQTGELEALRRLLRRIDVDGVVVGAVASDYQHRLVNRVAHDLGLRVFAPLWRLDPTRLVHDYLRAGLRIVFSSVSAAGFDASWLGRPWDDTTVDALLGLQRTHGVHPCGEGGEFETLVLDAPIFRQRLEVLRATPRWTGSSGTWTVDDARLVPKLRPHRAG